MLRKTTLMSAYIVVYGLGLQSLVSIILTLFANTDLYIKLFHNTPYAEPSPISRPSANGEFPDHG